mgnify:CR=1 FL=1
MSLWKPTRRELVASAPLALALTASPRRLFASPTSSLTFFVIGDWGRRGNLPQQEVARLMAARFGESGSQFVVSTGDNFYNLGVTSTEDSHWQRSFERVYSAELRKRWYALLGNHDYGGSIGAQIKMTDLDRGWRMCRRWWDERLADWPEIHLFFIDTVVWRGVEDFPYKWLGSSIPAGDQAVQAEWLDRSLRASNARFKLVFGHHPIYSIGPHGGMMQLKELDDILRGGKATAYINGHDHCLYYIEKAGIHYVCSGAGSNLLREYSGDPAVSGCVIKGFCSSPALENADLPYWRFYEEDVGGFAAFSVRGSALELVFHRVGKEASTPFLLAA